MATLPRVEDTVALGSRLGGQLRAGDVVVLSGPLGAGKTVLAKGIAAAMDVDGPVTSPTFVLARVHPARRTGAPAMIHVDVYRLLEHTGADLLDELESLDLDTELDDAVVVVEWGEGLAERLSDRHLRRPTRAHQQLRRADRDVAMELPVSRVVLAIDTATPAVTAGVVADGDLLAERVSVDARAHAERITPNVLAALADAGLRMADLGAVVVGCGPGPFTGLRVGMATAAAYGHALGVPVHGVCSLDAIGGQTTGETLVVTDARRREVYWARYRDGVRIDGPAVSAPADVDPGVARGGGRLARARGAVRAAAVRTVVPDTGRPGGRGDGMVRQPGAAGAVVSASAGRQDAGRAGGRPTMTACSEPVTIGALTVADAERCARVGGRAVSR